MASFVKALRKSLILFLLVCVNNSSADEEVIYIRPHSDVDTWGWDSFGVVQGGYIANWNLDSTTNKYTVCDVQAKVLSKSWLFSKLISLGSHSKVQIHLTFSTRKCPTGSDIKYCREYAELYFYKSATALNIDTVKNLMRNDKFTYLSKISPLKVWDTQSGGELLNSVSFLYKPGNINGVYFALLGRATCMKLYSFKITVQVCPEKAINYVSFPKKYTPTDASMDLSVDVGCVNNAVGRNNKNTFQVLCTGYGNWSYSVKDVSCMCIPGFQPDNAGYCEACPEGQYKASFGDDMCLSCPANSNNKGILKVKCVCNKGFFRSKDNNQVNSTCAEPPSAPRNARNTSITEIGTSLAWNVSVDTGGEDRVFYEIHCLKCAKISDDDCTEPCESRIEYIPSKTHIEGTTVTISQLSAFTKYKLLVFSKNAISDMAPNSTWKYGEVFVQTMKSVPGKPIISVVSTSDSEILLSWELEYVGAETILNYDVIYYPKGKVDAAKTVTTTKNRLSIRGLDAGETYVIKVYGVSEVGKGLVKEMKITTTGGMTTELMIIIICTCVGFLLLVSFCVFLIVCCKRRRNRPKSRERLTSAEDRNGEVIVAMLPKTGQKTYIDPSNYDDPVEAVRTFAKEIDKSQIKLEKVIGGGEFGEVYKGTLRREKDIPTSVAVKVLKPGSGKKSRDDFLSEASIMGQFEDPNVIHLEGVVSRSKPTMIVTEYMANGALDNFLKQNDGKLSVLQLLGMARGVASGMSYLSSLSFIHRDLAARNVLVNENFVCKVADFGLSRELEDSTGAEYETKGGKIPVRWTAPEAINFRKFSTASDVWSYGILLWETMSFGQRPYWEWGNFEVIERVQSGYRLPPPMNCPKSVHQLMLNCWESDRLKRPKFCEIVRRLDEWIRSPDLLKENVPAIRKPINTTENRTDGSVKEWLETLKMSQYLDNFISAGYHHLDQVAKMTDNDLVNIGIRLIGHRNKIHRSIRNMKLPVKREKSMAV